MLLPKMQVNSNKSITSEFHFKHQYDALHAMHTCIFMHAFTISFAIIKPDAKKESK